MANWAEIVGDEIKFYDRQLLDTKPLDAFLATFTQDKGYASPRLPKDVAFVAAAGEQTMYFVEQPPRFVSFRTGSGLENVYSEVVEPIHNRLDYDMYMIPVPWEYYVMSIADRTIDTGFGSASHLASGLYLFWSKTQLQDPEQATLYPASLPNIGSNGSVCLGENGTYEDQPDRKLMELVNEFYDSDFNADLGASTGICSNIHDWLSYHDGHETVDLTDPIFDTLPADDGASIIKIAQSANFQRLTPPDNAPSPSSPKAFLERLLFTLPEDDGRRLMQMMRQMAPIESNDAV